MRVNPEASRRSIISVDFPHIVLVTQEMCESALSARGSMLQNNPAKDSEQLTVCDVKDALHTRMVFTELRKLQR